MFFDTDATAGQRVLVCDPANTWAVVGGTPGGANTQVQFNDGGVLGGDAGLTYNKTTDVLTAGGGLALPQGTITADASQLSGTAIWNAAGILGPAWKLNVTDTASDAAALLIDLQVGGASKWKVDKTGKVTQAAGLTLTAGQLLPPAGSLTAPAFSFSSETGLGYYRRDSFILSAVAGQRVLLEAQNQNASLPSILVGTGGGTGVGSIAGVGFSSGSLHATGVDTILLRDAANALTLRNGANAQTFYIGDGDVSGRLWFGVSGAAAANPEAGAVALYVRDDIDVGAGTATADCALRARKQDGTEVNIATLVTDGGCP
jgi:hypothetical protein